MTDLNDLVDAIKSSAPAPSLKRRMGVVTAINSDYTLNVKIAGSNNVITGVRYFANVVPPKVSAHVWLETDGRDWIATGAIAGLGGQHLSVKAYRTADLNVATGTAFTTVPWQAVEYDPYGMYSSGSGNITVPVTGRYLVTAQVTWQGLSGGYRSGTLNHSVLSTAFGYTQIDSSSTSQISLSVSAVRSAVAGESFYLQVRQGSAGALNLLGTTANQTFITVSYLGPAA